MKLLFLLALLISCGKHEMPKSENLHDSDGDQIVDKNEFHQRFIANIHFENSIEGQLIFNLSPGNDTKKIFRFSNNLNIKKVTYDMLTQNTSKNDFLPYFFENLFLFAEFDQKIPIELNDFSSPTFKILGLDKNATQIFLHTPAKTVSLNPVNNEAKFELTKGMLNELLSGKAYFSFRKQEQFRTIQEIERKSYRFFISDGEKAEIKYFSKQLNILDILALNKIEVFRELNEENIFTTQIEQDFQGWWLKRINQNDFILLNDSLSNISNHLLNRVNKLNFTIKRVHGVAPTPLHLISKKTGKMLLILRPTRIIQLYGTLEKDPHQVTNLPLKRCGKNDYRNAKPRTELVNQFFLEKNFGLQISPSILEERIQWRQLQDEKGIFWEVAIPSEAANLYLKLEHLPNSTNLSQNDDPYYCQFDSHFRKMEISFDLAITAFVENI